MLSQKHKNITKNNDKNLVILNGLLGNPLGHFNIFLKLHSINLTKNIKKYTKQSRKYLLYHTV